MIGGGDIRVGSQEVGRQAEEGRKHSKQSFKGCAIVTCGMN